jgi:glutathione reductase (NADPH)
VAAYDYDLVTLGAGSGGVRASRMSAQMGATVAIVESSRVGGTCVIRGCIPKKLLVYGAHFADDFEDAASYGWTLDEPKFDWAKLIAAKSKEIDRLNGVYISVLQKAGVEIVMGRARLADPHTVQVGDRRLTAKNILVATGARPFLPSIPGIEHAVVSDDIFDMQALPKRIAIIGGGYIALEFAGIFHGLGSEITIVVRSDKVLRGFDDDMRQALQGEMEKKGAVFHCGTEVKAIAKTKTGLQLSLSTGKPCEVDLVLYATGRIPNTQGIGLEEAGIKLNDAGAVAVDDYSKTSLDHIYAVGDVTNRLNLTPVAIAEGAAVARSLFAGTPSKADHRDVPTAVFSQPSLAGVGLTEAEARKKYGKIDVYLSSFRPLKFTLTPRQERTTMKLVVDRATDRVVGCHMVGMDAAEIIQGFAVAVKAGATKAQFDATVGIHPSAAEEFVTMRDKRPDPA